MNPKSKTKFVTKEEAEKSRKWYLLDAEGKTLGRFASEIAKILVGKHRTDYTPHIDCGDGVVVVNADKIIVTGNKEAQKVYRRYTGYIGGLRETPYRDMQMKKPEYIITHAVKGMVAKTKLGRKQLKKLRVFAKDTHNMQAQQPVKVNI
jgi:large subunit ribosomal protein L13